MPDFWPFTKRTGFVHVMPPAAPALSVGSTGPEQITLAWPDIGACGYSVFYGTAAGKENMAQLYSFPAGSTGGAIPGLTTGTTYFFVVKALGCANQGLGQPSNEVSAVAG